MFSRQMFTLPLLLLAACAAGQQPDRDQQLRAELARTNQKLDRLDAHLRALHADVGRLQPPACPHEPGGKQAGKSAAASQPSGGAATQPTTTAAAAADENAATRDESSANRKGGAAARLPRRRTIRFAGRFPDAEEGSEFTLRWKGGNRKIKLHGGPSRRQRVVGQVSWKDGAEIAALESTVVVTKPRRVSLRADTELPVRPYDWRANRAIADESILELRKGTVVEYYQYATEGDCFIGHEGVLYLATCSVAYALTAVSRPKAQQWWVRVKEGALAGWIRVDPAVITTTFHGR